MRPELGRLGGARDHRQRRAEREDGGGDPDRAVGRADREGGEQEDQHLPDGHRHRQGLHLAHRVGLAADAEEQRAEQQIVGREIEQDEERGRAASRPPARARPPALRPASKASRGQRRRSPRRAIPTSETASIANNLPRKIASIGIAAARTSMILFDFSSTRLESSMPASRMVSMNSSSWPARAVIERLAASAPWRPLGLDQPERRRGASARRPLRRAPRRWRPRRRSGRSACARSRLVGAGQRRAGRGRR